jgi:hypothetical protein
MNNVTVDTKEFLLWMGSVTGRSELYMKAHFAILPLPKFTVRDGSRYIRVFRDNSAYAFIDKTNGDVLMPASYKAPAKHPRGNIFNADNGLDCTGPYGIAYLKAGQNSTWV